MTNIIIGERCSGKTTRLILRSARDQLYILTSTKSRAHAIFDTARDMGLAIPFPVTLDEYLRGSKFQGSSIRRDGLLIDDVDDVVRTLFAGIPIREMALTDYGNVRWLETILSEKEKAKVLEKTKVEKGVKLKDLLKLFTLKHYIRIRIDGEYICDTVSDGAIADLYRDYSVVLISPEYEMRDDQAYLYLEVWLSKEEEE